MMEAEVSTTRGRDSGSSERADVELVADLRSGIRAQADAAFEEVVRRYGALIGSIGLAITGDAAGAQDVRQNVLVKVLRRIGDLDEPSRLKGWIGHITRTTAIDWMRRRKHLKISLDDVQDGGGYIPNASTGESDEPSNILASVETRRAVLAAIQTLPTKYREVLILKHISDASYNEISDSLGISVSAVESRLYRARGMLRARLERAKLLED